jgi:hypothetical protein
MFADNIDFFRASINSLCLSPESIKPIFENILAPTYWDRPVKGMAPQAL